MTTVEETRTGALVRLPSPLTPALVRALSGQHDDGEATLAVIPCDDGLTRIARRSWPGRLSEREARGVRSILAAHAAEALDDDEPVSCVDAMRADALRAMSAVELQQIAEGYGLLSPRHLVRLIKEHEAAQAAQVAAIEGALRHE